jgi:cathepsin B
MASSEQALGEGEERYLMYPLEEGAEPPPPSLTPRRWGKIGAVLLAAVAVACGTAVFFGTDMWKSNRIGLSTTPTKKGWRNLMIMKDMRTLPDDHYLPAGPRKLEDMGQFWSHACEKSELCSELTDAEKADYKARFLTYVEAKHKQGALTEIVLREALEFEKPAVTSALLDELNTDHPYHIQAMPGITKHDLEIRCGREEMTVAERRLQEQQQDKFYNHSHLRRLSAPPDGFDAATHFSHCQDVVNKKHNQGHCGSCWAFAALSVVDSRLCIKTNGGFSGVKGMLSRTYATACSYATPKDGCGGGMEKQAFLLVAEKGTPTGGTEGCLPYFSHGAGIDHFDEQDTAPPCPNICLKHGYERSLHDDKFKFGNRDESGMSFGGKIYWQPDSFGGVTDEAAVHEIMNSIMADGPVAAGVDATTPFMGYTDGIWNECATAGANHAVALTGWSGNTCSGSYSWNNCPSFYWLLLNSWGDWGFDNTGFMHIAACAVTDITIPAQNAAPSPSEQIPSPLFTGSTPSPGPSPGPSPSGGTVTPIPDDQAGSHCVTTGNDGVGPGVQCVFPFTYHGTTYETCTTEDHDSAWCATQTTSSGNFVSDKWGICDCQAGGSVAGGSVAGAFSVDSGSCSVDEDGCARSPGWPADNYQKEQSCKIDITKAVKLEVADFNTESGYDELTIKGISYSGGNGPHLKSFDAGTTMTWTSDYCTQSSGWKICATVSQDSSAVTCHNTPDDLEMEAGTSVHVTCASGCSDYAMDIWGDGTYTTDSGLCRAAIHAGMGTVFTIEFLGHIVGFDGKKRHGIETLGYEGTWTAFKFK